MTLPRWGKALIATVIVAGGGVGFILWQRAKSTRAWTALHVSTRSLIDEAKSRSGARSVLRGTPVEGNAWQDYLSVAYLLERDRNLTALVYPYLRHEPQGQKNREKMEAYLDSVPQAIEALRKGASRTDGAFPYDWDKEPGRLKAAQLGALGAAKALLLAEDGHYREAGEILLDVLQFGNDCRRNAAMIGEYTGASTCATALDLLGLVRRNLGPEDLATLDRALEIADREWPDPRPVLRNEMIVYRHAMQSEDFSWLGGPPNLLALKAWRYGFSVRRMAAASIDELQAASDRLFQAADRPWLEQQKVREEVVRDLSMSTNFFTLFMPATVRTPSTERAARARLRLLRAAIAHARTGSIPEFEDPYGGKLRQSPGKIWSVSKDGVDQNGTGEWSGDTPDLVLELP